MRILVVGYSSIVARRVLPALLRLPMIKAVDIASRRPFDNVSLPETWTGQTYDDYARAIADSHADLVYVSLVNSLHEEWAEASLLAGKHVIVDKPAFLSLRSTERLLELADQKNLSLSEAVVFGDHPQIGTLKELISQNGGVTRVAANFSTPPLPLENFRNHTELGGGSLYDLGPYVTATWRLFFKNGPERVECRIVSRHPVTGVDIAFSVLATFGEGRSYIGHFGFDTEYQNRLTVIGPRLAATVDRVFTTPPDVNGQLSVNRCNQHSDMTAPAGDSFELFFSRVVDSVKNGSWTPLANDLLEDARMMEKLRQSAFKV